MADADEQAFAAMVREHSTRMYRLAYAVLRHRETAEDAVQETFLKMHRTGAWKGATNARALLSRAVWRTALDLSKRKRAHFSLDSLSAEPSIASRIEQDAAQRQTTLRMNALIAALPDRYRFPLLLTAGGEMTSRDAAFTLGLPESTVRRRCLHARRILRVKYERLYGEFS